jgi:hypothetical protein
VEEVCRRIPLAQTFLLSSYLVIAHTKSSIINKDARDGSIKTLAREDQPCRPGSTITKPRPLSSFHTAVCTAEQMRYNSEA